MITLTIFGAWLGLKTAEKTFDKIFDRYTSNISILEQELNSAINDVSSKLKETYPDVLDGSIEYFFRKEEVFNNLMKLLSSFSNDDVADFSIKHFENSTLPNNFIVEFIEQLKSVLRGMPNFCQLLNDKELYLLIRGLSTDISSIAITSALTYGQISEIRQILSSYTQNYFDYYDFYDKYKTAALNNLSQVNFIGLGIESHIRKSKKKLSDIFVQPIFSNVSSSDEVVYDFDDSNIQEQNDEDESDLFDYDDEEVNINEIFDFKNHLVILGDPGSGKSLCVKYIICSILMNKINVFKSEAIFTFLPIRIELRKYLAHKRNVSCNFLGYLKHLLENEYNINITELNLRFILKQRRVLILFDGLDEIFDINDKIDIKNDIETFCISNDSIRAIVTSRIIGYAEAKLNETFFTELHIREFNEAQIIDYVSKWYNFEESDEEVREKEIKEFIEKKSRLDNELVKNPLLLSLIVILFRNNLKLPESKLEIYQSCTKTLVDKWDASKNLQIDLDENLIKKKETIIADLAYWQYQTLSSKSIKITYQKARKTIADCLLNKLKIVDNLIEASSLAESFLQYAENRSIYFDNNFTHKTFLEYYTAYWIYSNFDKKQLSVERDKIITKYIENTFWAIVLELLLNLIDDDQPDNEIIDRIYLEQSKNAKALPFLLEVLPTLENISNEEKKNIIEKSIQQLIDLENTGLSGDSDLKRNVLFDVLSKTISQEARLMHLFLDLYFKVDSELIDEKVKINHYLLMFELISNSSKTDLLPIEHFETLRAKDKDFKRLLTKNAYLYIASLYLSKVENYNFNNVIEFIETFGKNMFFENYSSVYAGYRLIGIHHYFIRGQIKFDVSNLVKNIKVLESYGIGIQQLTTKYRSSLMFHCSEAELKDLIDIYTNQKNNPIKNLLKNLITYNIRRNSNLMKSVFEVLPAEIITAARSRN